MFVKFSGKYLKFVATFAILGFLGVFAYLVIRERFIENTTVTVYEIATPANIVSQSNSNPFSAGSRERGVQIGEPNKRQSSEASESSTSSNTNLNDAQRHTPKAKGIDDRGEVSSNAQGVENSSNEPEISAEDLRRRELENRQSEILKQLEAMAREDGVIPPDDMPQAEELHEEILRIAQELGTLISDDGSDPFRTLEMGKFLHSNMTRDGKLPVSMGPRLADMFEEDGDFESADKMRMLTQRALENGDEFFKQEHLEVLQ